MIPPDDTSTDHDDASTDDEDSTQEVDPYLQGFELEGQFVYHLYQNHQYFPTDAYDLQGISLKLCSHCVTTMSISDSTDNQYII